MRRRPAAGKGNRRKTSPRICPRHTPKRGQTLPLSLKRKIPPNHATRRDLFENREATTRFELVNGGFADSRPAAEPTETADDFVSTTAPCPAYAPAGNGDALRVELEILLDAIAHAGRLASGVRPATVGERRLHAALRQIAAAADGLRPLVAASPEIDHATETGTIAAHHRKTGQPAERRA